MSWTQDQQNSAQQKVNEANATAQNELQALPYYQELITRGISSGQTNMAKSKSVISKAIEDIQVQMNLAKQAATAIQQAQQSTDLASLNNNIQQMQTSVDKKKTLHDLRQEQANALANKYASNNYSPFLFLYAPELPTTPLSDVVRTSLYCLSAGLLFAGGALLIQRKTSQKSNMVGGSRYRKTLA
jgi:hypothetical protein